ncbi:MAG: 3-methyl-2-oxobutanoate hydroxymethyltransferase [Verrucomicrobia bacterium]|nr:3-methyl-2-oxobutanoate hydroxymethyltransferase [Verrucomicrobiota bacterium]
MKTITDLARARRELHPIVMIAAYDALMARIVAGTEADAILVGDSVAMVVHGHPSTVHATLDMMAAHTAAVRRGAPDLLVVADLPFLTARRGVAVALEAAGVLMQAGATAVKLEGVTGHEDVVARLVESGIPVMGHLGLTPQSVNQFGGYRVQGREPADGERVRREAQRLEELGAFAIVLECVPAALSATITEERTIPTIGIGAGIGTSGQVLVLSDLLGLDAQFQPRFVRRYAEGHTVVHEAVNRFARDVRAAQFPAREEVLA